MNKKIYVIDRNGRMHPIELDPSLFINDIAIADSEQAETLLKTLFAERQDIVFKTNAHLKVFDSAGLIGFQIVPDYE
jgi:hypothetical protein